MNLTKLLVFLQISSGQIEAICMLLQQNKIQVDAKNVFGFTPLMKAAIQGHTRCAKALLLAGNDIND